MGQGNVTSIHIGAVNGEKPTAVDEVHAVAGKGLEGDRYFDTGADRQVTLIETEAIEALARDNNLKLDEGDARRNIVTRGVALNHLVGREFKVGEVTLRGVRLCEPCAHLAEMTDQKALSGLVHRGGLRAEILSGGVIRVGDAVEGQA